MAIDENDTGEKTEEPTGRRLSESRQQGDIAKSIELSQVMGMTAAFLALRYYSPVLWDDLLIVTKGGLSGNVTGDDLHIGTLYFHFLGLLRILLPDILFLVIIAAIFGAGTTALQTKFLWSNRLLKPKWMNVNPIKGLKRIFSINNAFNVFKSLAKLAIIGPIAYFAFMEIFPETLGLMDVPLIALFPYTGDALSLIFWRIITLLLVLAILDFAWQKWRHHTRIKMTKVEVKEEKKQIEGDEKTRMKIRQVGLQRARDRMMKSVPTADVVVTNPTHLAVALQYTMEPGSAPKVIAKGRGYVAERIKKLAREHNIPVLERKPLARALFKACEVGQEIPYELFAAVAELLAYVYRIKGKDQAFMRQREQQTATQ